MTLLVNSVEGVETLNIDADGQPTVVPGVSPAPEAFDGQFIQMDVISVVPN